MKLTDFALLADENIHPDIVHFLRKKGFTIKDVKESGLSGRSDIELLNLSFAENLIVVTQDADFGKIIYT